MDTLNPIYHQYRSFDLLYLFKIKGEDRLVLKVFTISQKCLFKRVILTQDIKSFDIKQALEKNDFHPFLETLIQKQLLPREHFPAPPIQTNLKDCLEATSQIIQKYKPKVLLEGREIEKFSCPITLEIFFEPVMDEHGHTFERSAIETCLQKKNECPISREPIYSLTPNRIVKQTIEEWQQRDPIPNFTLFQKENPTLAKLNLQTAQAYVQEKEYTEALQAYAKAFQYTKKWTDYASLPILFEEMQKKENAILSYLYLALYQLEDEKIPEALHTLEQCEPIFTTHPQVGLLLIKLYELQNLPEKANQLALRLARTLTHQSPEHAIYLYRHLLIQRPDQLELYSILSKLLKTPEEKAHILLKGACHAMQTRDYKSAERLTHEAMAETENSFIDQLIALDLLKKQKGPSAIKEKLLAIAEIFEQKELTEQMLRTYKMLYQIKKAPEYSQKIIEAYEKLQKPSKQTNWYVTTLSLFIEQKDWPNAHKVAQEALKKANQVQKIPLYEKLEVVYTHWNNHELEDLWGKLGKAYQIYGQITAAEKTYRKLFETFHGFDQAIALAQILSQQRKIKDSVQTYYEASIQALLEENTEKLTLSTREIKTIDPHMRQLDPNQRMHLLTQSHILKLNEKISAQNERISILEEQERQRVELKVPELKFKEELLRIAFGAKKWNQYFGNVGAEPPLPPNIESILNSPCLFWPGKKVFETHLLILIPATVNGKPFTLNSLQELIQNPKDGHKAQYKCYTDYVRNELGNQSTPSDWVLMTRDVIPNSRSKSYEDQKKLVTTYVQISGQPYELPMTLDVVTCILMEHVQTGIKLYSDSPCTLTRCQEKVANNQCPVAIGGFAAGGLVVSSQWSDHVYYGVGISRRF